MDSDDDYQTFSPSKEPSPQAHYRRLKRLKKSNSKPMKDLLPDPIDDPLLFPKVDFARLEALENDSEFTEFNESNSSEELVLSQESLSIGIGNENAMESEERMEFHGNGRVIEEASVGFEQGQNEKERFGEEDLFEEKEDDKKKKKEDDKKKKKEDDKKKKKEDDLKKKRRVKNDSETRDASFRPIPVVQKPISSVLEKIRKRKLEISRKAMVINDRSYGYEGNSQPSDKMLVLDVSIEERGEENVEIIVEKETVAPSLDGDISLAASGLDEFKDAAKQTIHENNQNQVLTDFGLSKIGLMNCTTELPTQEMAKNGILDANGQLNTDKVDSHQSAVGTPDYLAPEILLGTEHGYAADWWSVGIILFEFITGVPPFNADHPENIFDNILNRKIPWPLVPNEMSYEAQDLIDRFLVHDPNQRLGANGASEVKAHSFFSGVDWDNLTLQKAAFVPQPERMDDTSYFVSRYNTSGMEVDEISVNSDSDSSELHMNSGVEKMDECGDLAEFDSSPLDLSLMNFSFKNLSQLASINQDVLLQSGKESSRCSSPCKVSLEVVLNLVGPYAATFAGIPSSGQQIVRVARLLMHSLSIVFFPILSLLGF
ncbi:putative serine/threonine protein kinase IREH1 [Sesamum angolense]|uniref:non-specific serine/threonine protein kinase n=1 Tax=Sesamum angolense TaxID=2727404 RepID=A0AAE2BMD1_9LAMI|nr:putative serine/threonine protein kinase IREH1 [Sesamum angolense]